MASTTVRAVPDTRPAPARRLRRGGPYSPLAPWAFLAPSALFLLVFFVAPFFFIVYVSFHHWDMLSAMTPAGWSNYAALIFDPLFRQVVLNTALYTLGCLVVIPPLGLGIALLLNAKVRLQGVWRTLYFSPMFTSQVAIALVWGYLLNPEYGPVNNVLISLGIPFQQWLSSPTEVLWVIVAISTWQTMGYYAVLYLAGLQSIPADIYEAAALDGASGAQGFWHITFPSLKETHIFVWIILTINSLQVFIPVYILTGGGPANDSNVVLLHIYQTAFQYLNMGQASAMSVVLFVVIMLATMVELAVITRGRWADA